MPTKRVLTTPVRNLRRRINENGITLKTESKENVKIESEASAVHLKSEQTTTDETIPEEVRGSIKRESIETVKEDCSVSSKRVRASVKIEFPEVKEENDESVKDLSSVAEKSLESTFSTAKLEKSDTNVFSYVAPEDVTASQPKNWDSIYNTVVDMRKLIVTPVDTMGCERMPDTITPGLSVNNPKSYRFQLLISLMLSSQTKDEVNYSAMVKLNNHFRENGYVGLCLEACLAATESELDECIKLVGFHRRKATYIKKTCEMIQNQFYGDIPHTLAEIVSFPGVGPKMGHLLLQNAWGIILGIGVDVHLHRLAQMWGWVPKSEKPEVTRLALQDWLPAKYWADINPLLVGFGQTVCVPRFSNCDVCLLASKGLCRGVNRKLARTEITEARREKLAKQRGNLLKLVELRESGMKT